MTPIGAGVQKLLHAIKALEQKVQARKNVKQNAGEALGRRITVPEPDQSRA